MFVRMIAKAFLRQWKKMLMIAFTIALGASLATAMLSVMMDVEDKMNQELKAYGANITVVPKSASVISDLYDVGDENVSGTYLREDELGKIKTIFWASNIVDFTPFISTEVTLDNGDVEQVTGTWFNHHMDLPTGEALDAGIASLRSWWTITEGDWLDEQGSHSGDYAMVGTIIAQREQIKVGDKIHVTGEKMDKELEVVGIFDAGGDEDEM
ncbi:MAG: ABC transporter permease, partial [Lachnospiraceae bacterium]|nr:ABC transporter permease [Lachnospiraceae bacterium]